MDLGNDERGQNRKHTAAPVGFRSAPLTAIRQIAIRLRLGNSSLNGGLAKLSHFSGIPAKRKPSIHRLSVPGERCLAPNAANPEIVIAGLISSCRDTHFPICSVRLR